MLRQEERLPKRLTAGARARKLPNGEQCRGNIHPKANGQRSTVPLDLRLPP